MVYTIKCSCKAACKCSMHAGKLSLLQTNKCKQKYQASCCPELKPQTTITWYHLILAFVTRNTVLYVCCKRTYGRQRLGAGRIGVVPGLQLTWPSAAALQSSVCIVVWRICVRSTLTLLRSAADHSFIQQFMLSAAHWTCSQALTSYCSCAIAFG